MNVTEFVAREKHPHLVWLGKIDGWLRACRGLDTPQDLRGLPIWNKSAPPTEVGVNFIVDGRKIEAAPGYAEHGPLLDFIGESARKRETRDIIALDMFSAFFAHGPKFFIPTQEQWESMENVKPSLPLDDFSSPYPALSIRIPQNCRQRIADHWKMPRDVAPRQCLVRWRKYKDEPVSISLHIGQRYGIEGFYHFMETTFKGTLEDGIVGKRTYYKDSPTEPITDDGFSRRAFYERPGGGDDGLGSGSEGMAIKECPEAWQVFETICRTSLNLCLMLTHFGHKLNDPNDPKHARNRRERREMEERKTHDFAAVEMKQTITIRAPGMGAMMNEPGPGTGIEVRPHWRKGHWRAYPGQAKLRAEGKAKLLFVRPCLVRRDRMSGDESESQVTYRG